MRKCRRKLESKKFGAKAITAMLNEYKQLNIGLVPGKPVFGCIDPSKITNDEKRRALEAVNLIKKKIRKN